MTSEPASRWPRFELTTFKESVDVPRGLAEALLRHGAPRALLGRYLATDELAIVDVPRHGALVRFGTSMLTDSMCLDPKTGAVVEVVDVPGRPVSLVNSSLQQFTESVRIVLARFPFYSRGSELEERIQVGDELTEAIRRVDPAALEEEGFWVTFIDDVKIGDFATEDVISNGDA